MVVAVGLTEIVAEVMAMVMVAPVAALVAARVEVWLGFYGLPKKQEQG